MTTLALLAAALGMTMVVARQDQLKNPVVRGLSPDPSIVRVGSDYYLVNSSFEYFPGVPIRHSTNLSDWTLIGHCLTTPAQLPLTGQRSSQGIFAPTIRHHDGTFYMITTNIGAGGNFLVTAKDIRGPWSERVMINVPGIDPSLFWDEDGTCYLTVQASEGVRQAVFDPKTGKTLSELHLIWKGTGGQWPEAPHLFKKDGYYYLTIAEGGTEYGHMQTLARSRSPFGPFEECPFNPILTHRSIKSPFQAIGHADFFDDGKGNWWAVCLGTRPQGYPYGHHLGRETFLVPVVWAEDGWPRMGTNGTVPLQLDLPASKTADRPETETFPQGRIPLEWSYLRNPDKTSYQPIPEGGLRLRPSKESLADIASPTWIGRPQTHLRAKLTVECTSTLTAQGEGGISLRQNEKHRIELFLQNGNACLRTTIGPLSAVTKTEKLRPGPVFLEVVMHPDRYEFFYRSGEESIPMGTVPTHYLSTEVAGGFTGVMLGLYAHSPEPTGHFEVQSWTYIPGAE